MLFYVVFVWIFFHKSTLRGKKRKSTIYVISYEKRSRKIPPNRLFQGVVDSEKALGHNWEDLWKVNKETKEVILQDLFKIHSSYGRASIYVKLMIGMLCLYNTSLQKYYPLKGKVTKLTISSMHLIQNIP